MQQVPADRVIAILSQEIADLHREQAILKVQVAMYEEQEKTSATSGNQSASVGQQTSALPSLPQVPNSAG